MDVGLWFDDGNIVLVAEDTPFKVHRGVLAQSSQVLKNILSVPQPRTLDEWETMDGVSLLHMSDSWKDLSYVLSALYKGYK